MKLLCSGPGIILLGLSLIMANMAIWAEESGSTRSAKRTPEYTGQGADGCLRCHSGIKMHAVAASAHGTMEHRSSPLAAHGCEACHGPGSIHVSRAHGGRGFPPLTRFGRGSQFSTREDQIDACLACHTNEMGAAGPIQFRGSPHDRRNINCSTCHQVHAETDPMNEKEQQASTCYRCHRKQKTEHPRFEDKSIDFEALSCGTCHDVHVAVHDDE